jgi:hypothetical protein
MDDEDALSTGPIDCIVIEHLQHEPTGEAFPARLDLVDPGRVPVRALLAELGIEE